jgi:twitching motility protein PilT
MTEHHVTTQSLPNDLRACLTKAARQGASDIHLIANQCITIRLHGELVSIGDSLLSPQALESFLSEHLDPDDVNRFETNRNLDLAMELDTQETADANPDANPGKQRFRVNLFYSGDVPGACFRVIPSVVPNFSWANFPTTLAKKLCSFRNGLVIFSGVTGSGKTTSLAMVIQEILRHGSQRVITVEDPIEYRLPSSGQSLISQREVGRDVNSFADGLKYAMRQDPNLILVGEIRDEATARMALSAAETGHLVLTTLHTRDAKGAVTRLIDLFPNQNHAESCSMLSIGLRAVICQHLLPSVFEGEKRELAVEVMYNTHPIAAAIRTGRFDSLDNAILAGKKDGMVTLNESVKRLLQDDRISRSVANRTISEPSLLNG